MGRLKKYDIYTVDFPYDDTEESKTRPALVITDVGAEVVAHKITTKKKSEEMQLEIVRWREAGLDEPSYIYYSPIYKIDKDLFVKRIGRLQEGEILKLEQWYTR